MANLESSIGDRGLNIVTSISLIKTYWARIAKVSGSLPQKALKILSFTLVQKSYIVECGQLQMLENQSAEEFAFYGQ